MTTTLSLGGPGAPCSINRIRRLRAGELSGEEKARTAAHLMTCERCRASERELERQALQLQAEVPFEAFAASVAERLARPEPKRFAMPSWAPIAIAACLILGIAGPVAVQRFGQTEDGVRSKGAVLATLYVKDARGIHTWQPGDAVAEDADVHAELRTGAHAFAAAVLVEGNDVHPLFSGLSRTSEGKPRVVSFGWTGKHGALLVIAASPKPIEAAQLAAAVRQDKDAPQLAGAEIATLRLTRR